MIALYGKQAGTALRKQTLRTQTLGTLMLVRYADSPVGPYDELLWATAPNPSPVGPRPQVQKIVVSSEGSVEWGRRNWGIPKGLARFEWQEEAQTTQVRIYLPDGQVLAHLAYRTQGSSLPVSTFPVPAQFRTLAQPALDGDTGWLLTTVSATGKAQAARLTVLDTSRFHAPLMQLRPLLTLAVPEFQLVFPVPEAVVDGGL